MSLNRSAQIVELRPGLNEVDGSLASAGGPFHELATGWVPVHSAGLPASNIGTEIQIRRFRPSAQSIAARPLDVSLGGPPSGVEGGRFARSALQPRRRASIRYLESEQRRDQATTRPGPVVIGSLPAYTEARRALTDGRMEYREKSGPKGTC
jgi:hypothetical protein